MGVGKHRARVDDNQSRVVKLFREMGCSVHSLAAVGNGCPDLIVGRGGVNVLVEVKDGTKPPSKRRLTEAESDWHRDWKGWCVIVEDDKDVINLVKQIVPRGTLRL